MAFGTLLFRAALSRIHWYALAISFAGIVLAMGRNGLFGGVYAYMFDHVPGFWMYREPYAKFGMFTVFGYSILVGSFVQGLCDKLQESKRRMYAAVPIAAIAVIFLAGWPVFTKYYVLQGDESGCHSPYVVIPDYWKKAAAFVNTTGGEFRLLEMPDNKSSYTVMRWESGMSGGVPEQCMFRKPVVTSSFFPIPIVKYFYCLFDTGMRGVGERIFRLLNVKWLYQRNDVVWQFLGTTPPGKVRALLEDALRLKKIHTFDKLDFYATECPERHVYLKDAVDMIVGGFQSLPALSNTEYCDAPALHFWGQPNPQGDKRMMQGATRVVFCESDPDGWLMRLIRPYARLEPERFVIGGQHDHRTGWCSCGNFYFGEWVDKGEHKYVNDDFFENQGAAYTTGSKPLRLSNAADVRGKCTVGVRAYVSGKGERFSVDVDGSKIRFQPPSRDVPRLAWFFDEAPAARISHAVSVTSDGPQALIDSIVFFSEEQKAEAVRAAAGLLQGKEVVVLLETGTARLDRRDFRIYVPGEYRVSLAGLQGAKAEEVVFWIDDSQFRVNLSGGGSVLPDTIRLSAGVHSFRSSSGGSSPFFVRLNALQQVAPMTYQDVQVDRIGPTRLLVKTFRADRPLWLVFNETYHAGWKAYALQTVPRFRQGIACFINCLLDRSAFREMKDHVMVNGYANAFYLPKAGEYTILLEFDPQNDYERGLLISLVAAGISLFLVLCYGFFKYCVRRSR